MKTPPQKPEPEPDTARHVALSTTEVLRKLDNSSLSLDEDTAAGGKPSARQSGPMPGGGVNPYETRLRSRSSPARDVHRGAAPTAARGAGTAAKAGSPASGRGRASWWRRLLRRD